MVDPSPSRNSLFRGKIQGILSGSEPVGPSCCQYASVFSGEVEQIAYLQEQGIFTAKQGTSTHRELSPTAAGHDLSPRDSRLRALSGIVNNWHDGAMMFASPYGESASCR